MIALSVALVLVALVARDVVRTIVLGQREADDMKREYREAVRALAERMRERSADVQQVAAALDAETVRLSEVRADVNRWGKDVTDDLATLKAEVATLKMNQGLRGRA